MCVTVVIPVYNAAKYVKEAVNSALLQQEVSEILIIEDGSTDGSLKICQELEDENERVRVLCHPESRNLGPSVSRNLGIAETKTAFVAFLDADDIYTERRFEDTLINFEENAEVEMIFESAEMRNNDFSKKVEDRIFFQNRDPKQSDFESYFMGFSGWITLNTTTFRKSAFDKIGLFDENLWQIQDTDLLLRAFLQLKLLGLDNETVVSIARSHRERRTYNETTSLKYKALLYEKWYPEILSGNFSSSFNRHFINVMLFYRHNAVNKERRGILRKTKKLILTLKYIMQDPRLLRKLL